MSPAQTDLEVFNTALEIADLAERDLYLHRACAHDRDLQKKVEQLLQVHARAAIAFNPLLPAQPRSLPVDEPWPRILDNRYRLIEKLGEGGCGVVFLAEQQEPVRRRVALKILKAGLDTTSVIARFGAERHTLALMEHPNIARLFDAGATEMGRPYFVMELVAGVKVTDYCFQNDLAIRERLRLFLQVCDAVQHAHQKGIIHRDLKPSNILVSDSDSVVGPARRPIPKIIDFGIAKATQGRLTGQTVATRMDQLIGTPAYMSPEQALITSEDIDTRSDIYSLGVLLYELLTGKPPFDNHELLTAGLDEMRRIIREVEPRRPSRLSVTTHHLRLPSDLDCIIMKCLEKDRSRRYETANGLAADIQRHLSHEPIMARPPSAAYRFQKFVHRNKVEFAASAIVLLALLFTAIVSSWLAVKALGAERRARAQSILAQKESENARAVKEFLIENLLGVDCCGESPDSDALTFQATQALVQKVSRRLEGKFTSQPSTEAEIRAALARALQSSRDFGNIAFHAEKALAICLRTLGATHTNTLDAVKELANAKYHLGQKKEAFDLLSNSLSVTRSSTDVPAAAIGGLLGNLGELQRWEGRYAEALSNLHQAFPLIQSGLNPKHIWLKAWKGKIATATEWAGDLPKGEKLYRELCDEATRDLGPEHPFTLQSEFWLGRVLVYEKNVKLALPILERVTPLLAARLGATNYSTLDCKWILAQAYEQAGQINQAAQLTTEIYPLFAKHFPYSSAIQCSSDIAEFFVRHDAFEKAKAVFDGLRQSYEIHSPDNRSDFERFLRATAAAKGWPAAATLYAEMTNISAEPVLTLLKKAWLFRYVGREEAYRAVVTEALKLDPGSIRPDERHLPIEIAALRPLTFSSLERETIAKCIATQQAALPNADANHRFWASRAIAQMQLQLGRFSDAVTSLTIMEEQAAKDPYAMFIRAACLHGLGQSEDAKAFFKKAVDLSNRQLPQPLSATERFLTLSQLYQHRVMQRETEALLAGQGGRATR